MIDRRTFNALLAGTVAMPATSWAQAEMKAKTAFYQSVGPELSLFDIDVEAATLSKQSSVTLPANVQYPGRIPPNATSMSCRATAAPGLPVQLARPTGRTHFVSIQHLAR